MLSLIYIVIGIFILLFIIGASLYKRVPADEADVVIQQGKPKVYSAHADYNESSGGKNSYFNIPSWFFIGGKAMQVTTVPLTIIPVDVPNFLAFDKDRARFVCDIVAYVNIKDPIMAAKRFGGRISELKNQINVVIQSTTRQATTLKTVREIINNREDLINTISPPLKQTLENWGLGLNSIELIDFKDPTEPERAGEQPPHVIADISSMVETRINSEATQQNAEQTKQARIATANTNREASMKEIETQEQIAKRQQEKDAVVATQQKEARNRQIDVDYLTTTRNAEIAKAKAIVEANQKKEVEEINRQQKELVGQGDQLMQEAQAKGAAAKYREDSLAQAAALDAKQKALVSYTDSTIRALVAEKVVDMQLQVGIAGAKAIEAADIKIFIGSDGGKSFDMGKAIEATKIASMDYARAVLNQVSHPLDLGQGLFPLSPDKSQPATKA